MAPRCYAFNDQGTLSSGDAQCGCECFVNHNSSFKKTQSRWSLEWILPYQYIADIIVIINVVISANDGAMAAEAGVVIMTIINAVF